MTLMVDGATHDIDHLLTEWTITVTPQEARQLADLAIYLTSDPSTDPEAFCRDAKRASVHLPKRIAEALRDFGRWGTTAGVIVIRGLPLGQLPATPLDNRAHLGERTMLARVQAILNEFIGNMIGYEAEGYGRLFQDMVPSPEAARTQTSLSSEVELELHTEQAFSPLRPDYLSLACLRGDETAATHLLTAAKLVRHLSAEDILALRQPCWTTQIDESFRLRDHEFVHGELRGPMPILAGSHADPFILLDQDLMRGVDPDAQALLELVIKLYPQLRMSHTLQAGDVLILDNARVVHGRSRFVPRFDGTDRFVVRSFITCDLPKSRHARPFDGRVVSARYS